MEKQTIWLSVPKSMAAALMLSHTKRQILLLMVSKEDGSLDVRVMRSTSPDTWFYSHATIEPDYSLYATEAEMIEEMSTAVAIQMLSLADMVLVNDIEGEAQHGKGEIDLLKVWQKLRHKLSFYRQRP